VWLLGCEQKASLENVSILTGHCHIDRDTFNEDRYWGGSLPLCAPTRAAIAGDDPVRLHVDRVSGELAYCIRRWFGWGATAELAC
jgi:hypothetical protein